MAFAASDALFSLDKACGHRGPAARRADLVEVLEDIGEDLLLAALLLGYASDILCTLSLVSNFSGLFRPARMFSHLKLQKKDRNGLLREAIRRVQAAGGVQDGDERRASEHSAATPTPASVELPVC